MTAAPGERHPDLRGILAKGREPGAGYRIDDVGKASLIEDVARAASISPEQAEAAVRQVLVFLASRLPSPIIGRLRTILDSTEKDLPNPKDPTLICNPPRP
jgi:hypothetical protein